MQAALNCSFGVLGIALAVGMLVISYYYWRHLH